jgi:hypothetical protein
MAQKAYRSRVALLLGTALILLLVSGSFLLPEIVSTYWHLRYGYSTTFHGWRIPVPRRWWAFTRDDLLIIQQPVRFYHTNDAPTISVELLSPSEPVDAEALKQASVRAFSKDGYVFQADRPIEIGTDPGYCLQFTTAKDQKRIHISCDSLSAHLALHLFGTTSEIQTFYSVIGQIRPDAH